MADRRLGCRVVTFWQVCFAIGMLVGSFTGGYKLGRFRMRHLVLRILYDRQQNVDGVALSTEERHIINMFISYMCAILEKLR
jgi:hypothetical protein